MMKLNQNKLACEKKRLIQPGKKKMLYCSVAETVDKELKKRTEDCRMIVSWKSYCKGDVGYYEIHRADGSYKTYIFFSKMLNDFDREDLIVLYRLLNEKYASTRPGFDDLMLWGDMKIMFEPDSDDEVWKNHQHQELIEWKLYDSCVSLCDLLGG
ncbi:hypothetical protein Tco_1502933 [Tanacetum coccineum]